MKTVMLIGGGVQEIRAVEFAQRLGYRVVVTDRLPDAPCVAAADESFVVDGTDIGALVSLAGELQTDGGLQGVFTLTELVTSVAAVSEALGLPGASVASAEICQDKGLAKREWLRQSIETPAGGVVESRGEAHRVFSSLPGPGIIKPVRGFGAIGVAALLTADDIDGYFDDMPGLPGRAWVVEELVDGASHDVNGLFDGDGVFHPQGIADREFVAGTFAEHQVHAPTRLTDIQQEDLYDLLRRCAAAFGIDSGPVKGDAILTDGGFMMLEIAPRLHGPKMSLYALPESGQDYWADFLSVITGGPVVGLPDLPTKYFLSSSIPAAPGRIGQITGVEEVRGWDEIVDVMLFRDVGDTVVPTVNSTDVVGYVLAATSSREDSAELVEQALDEISVVVG